MFSIANSFITASNGAGADATPAIVTFAIASRLADAVSNGLIEISTLEGMVVELEIHDHDPVSNCGFITFDHFYQSSQPRGQRAATIAKPIIR